MDSASKEPSPAPSAGSTIDDPELDEKTQMIDSENDISLATVPEQEDTPESKSKGGQYTAWASQSRKKGQFARKTQPRARKRKADALMLHDRVADGTEDEGSVEAASHSEVRHTMGTAVGTRRQANGTIGSVYSGNKIRHIKKEDGTPLWRKDIQFEFLRSVIEDTTPVFTRVSDGKKACNFADIYIDALARSSKTSKVLKDRLQMDLPAAKNMAMICLLVNVGRMNTTLNFFPEMRAQLRTYHSIPSLQAHHSQRDYKSLQDAPRLKSILKGASEDNSDEPRTLESVQERTVPRTNPVNLIFVLSQSANRISEIHFTSSVDFFDLVIKHTLSSKSRARAFLWLMWWYLESNFSMDDALANPFGPGTFGPEPLLKNASDIPLKVPTFEVITDEEGNAENVDTPEEQVFADKMQKERKRLLETDPAAGGIGDPDSKLVKRLKKSMGEDIEVSGVSDVDSVERGISPFVKAEFAGGHASNAAMGTMLGGQADSLDDDWEAADPHPGRGRYKRAKGGKVRKLMEGETPRSAGAAGSRLLSKSSRMAGRDTPDTVGAFETPERALHYPTKNVDDGSRAEDKNLTAPASGSGGGNTRRPRPLTQHQRALEEHKRERIEWVLRRRKRETFRKFKARREKGSWVVMAARRIAALDPAYDSEEEGDVDLMRSWGLGGLLGKRGDGVEDEDYGEEADSWVKVFGKAKRRFERWSGDADVAAFKDRANVDAIEKANDNPNGAQGIALKARRDARESRIKKFDDMEMKDVELGSSPINGAAERHDLARLDKEITEDILAERSEDEIDDDDSDDENENAYAADEDTLME